MKRRWFVAASGNRHDIVHVPTPDEAAARMASRWGIDGDWVYVAGETGLLRYKVVAA